VGKTSLLTLPFSLIPSLPLPHLLSSPRSSPSPLPLLLSTLPPLSLMLSTSVKCCLLGDESVGKTSLLKRAVKGTFSLEEDPTVGYEERMKRE
jgi:Ras of Complex, Roc, domain of DAPkinase